MCDYMKIYLHILRSVKIMFLAFCFSMFHTKVVYTKITILANWKIPKKTTMYNKGSHLPARKNCTAAWAMLAE